jgi:hypothetical protein
MIVAFVAISVSSCKKSFLKEELNNDLLQMPIQKCYCQQQYQTWHTSMEEILPELMPC